MSDDEENSLVVNDYLYGVTLDCMMNKSQKHKYMAKTCLLYTSPSPRD